VTLEEYRNRFALYKSDADLKSAHAAFPWIVTWDDHEVQNDYADDRSQFLDPAEAFLERRTAAYRAYYEHMPLPAGMRPRGREMRIYTRAAYGALVDLHVLDDRQYRSHQACPREGRGGSNVVPPETCPALRDPSRTLLGAAQERWLADGLAASRARWDVIAQQTIMAQVDRKVGDGQAFWTDGWDGYPRARERLLSTISGQRVANPVVIGGDVHMYAVADLKLNFDDPASPVVATEFVGTSITSAGPTAKQTEAWRADNPHIHFGNGTQRGYTTMELTSRRCIARMRAVGNATDSAAGVRTLATWTVEDGRPGAQRDA
jgi:alkaline phosphatase D